MVVDNVRHMNRGDGENSYSRNSSLQEKVILKVRPTLVNAIETHVNFTSFPRCFHVADFGCSSGNNTFTSVSGIIDAVVDLCRRKKVPVPEFHVSLNDLPENDFNSISASLPNFHNELREVKGVNSCFVSCVPGSFYRRLFPTKALHFVHSSYSLHWLSQVPDGIDNNKGNIYIGKTSPPNVFPAYLRRFQADFSAFLSCRADEMVQGGHMILTFLGRSTPEPAGKEFFRLWELLSQSLLDMSNQGFINETDIDTFNVPIYTPYSGEVEEIIKKQGSFNVDKLEIMEMNWDPDDPDNDSPTDLQQRGQRFAQVVRASHEPMMARHFGSHQVLDDLFRRFADYVAEADVEKTKSIVLVVSLTRNLLNSGK